MFDIEVKEGIDVAKMIGAKRRIMSSGLPQAIEEAMNESRAYEYFRKIARQRVQAAAHRHPESTFVLRVDGRDVVDLTGIDTAKKHVWAQWNEPLIDMAFSVLVAELKAAIKSSEKKMTEGFLLHEASLADRITVYHYSADKNIGKVYRGSVGDIKFRPGDTVMLIPDLVTALYANVKSDEGKPKGAKLKAKYSSRPFMKKAVDAIRKKAKVKRLASPIVIMAGRSRTAYNHVSARPARRKEGTLIDPLPKKGAQDWMKSAWAIMIMYRSQNYRRA